MVQRLRTTLPSPCGALITVTLLLALAVPTQLRAVEVLTVHELAAHCELMAQDPEGADAQYCVRYIQGFIDGAVATDVRVMLNAEADLEESFIERAKRTRAPSFAEYSRAAQLAEFCLGDPLPLGELVERLVADLVALDVSPISDTPAREAVYHSLRHHYPCTRD